MMSLAVRLMLVLALFVSVAPAQSDAVTLSVDVLQVLDLPITISDVLLVKTKSGYLLKCSLSNSAEFRQLGLRYSVAVVDSMNTIKAIVNRNEGFKLDPYQAKKITFKTPIRLDLKGDEHFVLMLEQVVSTDYVWEVIKAKEALAAYVDGDYSVTPRVLRVLNQVDTRP